MEYISKVRDTNFLSCKKCKYVLFPSSLDSHFKSSPHRLNTQIRQSIIKEARKWPDLVSNQQEFKEQVERIPKNPLFFPELSLYHDGLGCHEHSFIAKNRKSIQQHYRDFHDWDNPRPRGKKAKKTDEYPWETGIPCQQFTHSFPGIEYFRVVLSSPNNVISRRVASVRRGNESESENDNESSSDDNESSESSPQGM
jgi:hypothetical protein